MVAAILRALVKAVRRDLAGFGPVRTNNFFLFVALIVYGSGMVPVTKMIRTGIYFDVISIIVVWLGLRLLLPLIGLA